MKTIEAPDYVKSPKAGWAIVMLWFAWEDIAIIGMSIGEILFRVLLLLIFIPRFLLRFVHEITRPYEP